MTITSLALKALSIYESYFICFILRLSFPQSVLSARDLISHSFVVPKNGAWNALPHVEVLANYSRFPKGLNSAQPVWSHLLRSRPAWGAHTLLLLTVLLLFLCVQLPGG